MTPDYTSSTNPPIIIALDAAGSLPGIAVARGQQLLGVVNVRGPLAHAERFVPEIERLLVSCAVTMAEVGAVGVTLGPGSFTGVRVGLATARGLAFPRGLPLMGLSSLKALALAQSFVGREVITMVDPRRGRVYGAAWRSEGGDVVPVVPEGHYEIEAFLQRVSPEGIFVGGGAQALSELIKRRFGSMSIPPPPQSESAVAFLATYFASLFAQGGAQAVSDLTANYIQRSAAEEKRQAPV